MSRAGDVRTLRDRQQQSVPGSGTAEEFRGGKAAENENRISAPQHTDPVLQWKHVYTAMR